MVKTTKFAVKPYKRTINGKVYKVKGYRKSRRRLGKKVTFKKVGEFQVAHDEFGNIRGSKIKLTGAKTKPKPKKKTVTKKSIKRKRAVLRARSARVALNKIDTDFFLGNINRKEWEKSRERINTKFT